MEIVHDAPLGDFSMLPDRPGACEGVQSTLLCFVVQRVGRWAACNSGVYVSSTTLFNSGRDMDSYSRCHIPPAHSVGELTAKEHSPTTCLRSLWGREDRDFCEEGWVAQVVKKSPDFMNRKDCYCIYKSTLLDPFLRNINCFHSVHGVLDPFRDLTIVKWRCVKCRGYGVLT